MTVDKTMDCKVLVVDNSPVIVKLVTSVLEGKGCVVQAAVDGLEAIDLVDRFRPDIIFTDLVMPGIDGMKLCHIIRNTPDYKDIFIVVLSGVALEDKTDFLEMGADICIAKGTSVNMRRHILAALDSFLAGNRDLSSEIKGLDGLYPREMTRELLFNKRHYEVVFEQMQEGYLELNDKGRVLRVNPACCRIFQMEETDILASYFSKLLPEKNAEVLNWWLENMFVQDVFAPLVFDYDNPVTLRNHYITFNFIPVKDDNQLTIIVILQDVTRRKEMGKRQKELEYEIGRMRTLEALTGMAGAIARDFNNLLTVINGNVQMAQLIAKEDKVISLLKDTDKALSLATDLICQFSQFSDNYSPERIVVCVDDLLTDILERELTGTDVILNFINDGEKHYSSLNSELMTQGLRNIIVNAVEAMDGGGKLTVRLSAVHSGDDAGWIEQLKVGGRYVHISIEDTGRGMSQDVMDKTFIPYFSNKERDSLKGMGLELTIANFAIIKHGGLLCLGSSPRQGGMVSIYLPVTSVSGSSSISHEHKRLRILILDNDEMMLILGKRMFEQFNCVVTGAARVGQACRFHQESLKKDEPYDLVLMNLDIDGVDMVVREIQASGSGAMLIAMDGDTDNELKMAGVEEYFSAILPRPFSLEAVRALVNIYSVT